MPFTRHDHNGLLYDTADGLSAIGGVCHAFSTRHGGVSPAPFDTLNLADRNGETPERLRENYRRFGAAAGFDEKRLVCCRQIHGDRVEIAREGDGGGILQSERPFDADALVTNVPGLPLAVSGADCCIILLYDPAARAVGACHAGWRGTANGVLERTVETMTRAYGTDPAHVHAALGPSIGSCCFETDADVPEAMLASFGRDAAPFITETNGRYHVDLKGLNRLRLLRAGVPEEQIETHPCCTACRPDLFWSHRKMGERRGGMIAVIALREEAER